MLTVVKCWVYSKVTPNFPFQFNAPGISADKAHLLSTVIHNIEQDANYYSKAQLPFILKESR